MEEAMHTSCEHGTTQPTYKTEHNNQDGYFLTTSFPELFVSPLSNVKSSHIGSHKYDSKNNIWPA